MMEIPAWVFRVVLGIAAIPLTVLFVACFVRGANALLVDFKETMRKS